MTFLKKVSLIHRNSRPIPKLPNLLGPPKSNQTLKRYTETNCTSRAIAFFRELWRQNPSAVDSYSLLFVLKACTRGTLIVEGQQLHATVNKLGFEPIIFLQTCLVDLYSIAGNVDYAHRMFDEICCKNAVCWTSLITAYVDNDMPSTALDIFRQMLMNNFEPDQVTLTVALAACANLGALSMGEGIHAYICHKYGLKGDLCLNNVLLNMYAKCGEIKNAQKLFCCSRKKDIFTWTSMIVGHALHGQVKEALDLFAKLKQANRIKGRETFVIPNDVTFLGVLMACSHAGMVEEGKRIFKSMMQEYRIQPRLPHLGCMVDLFCRAGLLEEAYEFIVGMLVQPNAVMWRTLLGACFVHGNIELGAKVRLQLIELEPTYVGDDVALSNMYAAKGMWFEKMTVRDHMDCRRAPGYSSVEVGSEITEFVAGDLHHPLKAELYDVLGRLTGIVKVHSYMPEPADIMDF